MKVEALSSRRVQGPQGKTVQLSPGETYDLSQDIAETLISHGDAVEVSQYETQTQPPPETKVDVEPSSVDATDAAEEMAEEKGVDLSEVEGSGTGGRVTKGDVQGHL